MRSEEYAITNDRDGVSVEPRGEGLGSLNDAIAVQAMDNPGVPCSVWRRRFGRGWERITGPNSKFTTGRVKLADLKPYEPSKDTQA